MNNCLTANQTIQPYSFDYDSAFQINFGLITRDQQQKIKQAKIVICGMFGGGAAAIMLARSGFARFTLIDHNCYSIYDMNRDAGCYNDTLGQYKVEVIAGQIKRINPQAEVSTVTKKVTLQEIRAYIQESDIYLAQSDDIAFSCHSLLIAQTLNRYGITFMPSGMTAYVEAYPPGRRKVVDPAALFGAPDKLTCQQLYYFLRNPLNRCGRRWHITEGKWRIDWFIRWKDRKNIEAQLCPNVWLAAGLACTEIIKYVTQKWKLVEVPDMWHSRTADNNCRTGKFRRRSWWFERIIFRIFKIEFMGLGNTYRKYTARRFKNEISGMLEQEKESKPVRLPFMWKYLI
ncbi:MAG: ThiF family adenylyltransferase [Dehalococcoidales bacterium]|jgi:hypothetical protein|nr:ThiF family adenylyltransferase [Dehalococcoidales bacterium]MDD4466087.1 ThiF family adenylyltransferase [Dehalococcoidales bacterium]MDD5402618.1 ThiF family adenylyltransferase [Dehalococcoidales bacterium]